MVTKQTIKNFIKFLFYKIGYKQKLKDIVKNILYLFGFKQRYLSKKKKETQSIYRKIMRYRTQLSRKAKRYMKLLLNTLSKQQNEKLLKVIYNKRLKYFILSRLSFQYAEEKNFKNAVPYWAKALLLNGDNRYNDSLLRKTFYILSQSSEIDVFMEEFKETSDQELFIYFTALLAVIKRNNAQAIMAFKRIVNIQRKYYYKDSLFRLLKLLEKEKKDNEFWDYFQLYNEMSQGTDTVHYIQSIYFYNRNMYNECILTSKHLLDVEKYSNQAFKYIVNSLILLLRYDEALKYLNNTEYNISQYNIEHLYGVYYFHTLDYTKAIKFFNQAIGSHPAKNNLSILWLAKTYKNDQKHTKVQEIFNQYKNYVEEDVFTLNLAKSAGELTYIEDRLMQHIKQNNFNFEITEWFIKYLLLNRYWGRAYKLIVQKSMHEYSSDFLKKTKQELEEKFSHVNIDIKKEIKENKQIEEYMSSELIVDEILRKTKNIIKKEIPSKKIKRIALILTSLGPGGAERQCVNLLNGLIQKIDRGEIEDVRLFVTSLSRSDRESFYLNQVIDQSKVIEFYDRKKLIHIDEVPILEKFNTLIPLMQPVTRQQSLIYLSKHLDEFNPDVIHGFQNESILNGFLVGRMIGTPSLFGRWGSMPPSVSRNLTVMQKRNVDYMHWVYKTIEKEVENKIFSTNSQMAGRSYEEWIEADMLSVRTIYNGLNLERLQVTSSAQELKASLNLDEDAIIVGSILRVSDEKRPFLWANIAQEVNSRYHKKVHFILVGDGPLFEELSEYIIHKNLTDFIHLVGRHDDVANWYNIMNIFILTSAVEGIANAMLEAEYMGIPVIVPNVGGLKEAVIEGVTGYVLDDHSKENFATVICSTLMKEWTRKNSDFSSKYIKEKFSIPTMVKETLGFYHEILEK